MFQRFAITLQFRDKLYGGLPKSKKLIEQYVEAKFGPQQDAFAEQLAEEVGAPDLEEKIEANTTGFKRDEHGLYISDYQIKAMLKQCASLLKITVQVRGSKNVFGEGLFVKPPKLYLDRQEPDGIEEFCGQVTIFPVGKRSILRRAEYVAGATVTFQIWVVDTKVVTANHLKQVLELGQEVGLGSCRSFEAGKFDLVEFRPLEPPPTEETSQAPA